MKRYVLEVIIEEGSDEFWESLAEAGRTGCDEVQQSVRDILFDAGFQPPACTVVLTAYQTS